MGPALIWIEGLAAMLLLVALLAACSARWSRRLCQLALPLLAVLSILLLAGTLTYGAALLRFWFDGLVPHDWFFYTLSWTLVFLGGAWLLVSRGLKRTGDERVPSARSWPRGRLALGLAGMAILFAITLSNLDLAMKVQLAETRAEAGALLLALTPPPVDDKDNAAPIYQEAFAALTPIEYVLSRTDAKSDAPPWQRQLRAWWTSRVSEQASAWSLPAGLDLSFDWTDKELKAFLQSQERALSLLRKAAAKPACRFPSRDPLNFFDGAGRRYSPDSHFSQASQLLAVDARVQAAAGVSRVALEDIAALLGIARHTSDLTVEKDAWETLATVLHLAAPRPDELARLPLNEGVPYLRLFPKTQASYALRVLAMLSPEWPSYRFWDWTRELSFLHRQGQPMPEGYQAPFWFEATVVPLWRVFLAPDELLWIHRSLRECQDYLESPQQQTFADWHELVRALNAQQGGLSYVRAMKPRLASTARWACDVTTLRRFARLVVALNAYRAKHGEYPQTLEGLTPSFLERLPSDPWHGERLHMLPAEKSILLYTLRNGTTEPILAPDTSAQRRDIVFHLP